MISIKGKLLVCFMGCLIVYTPVLYSTSQCWSYRIDGISTAAMTQDGTHVLVGSSSGDYYLFNEYGEVVRYDDLEIEITSVDMSRNTMILGTKTATLILSLSGEKLSHFTSGPVLSVAISENDSCAISGTIEDIYIFSSLQHASETQIGVPVEYVSISPDGKKAAAATSDRIYLYTIDNTVTRESYEISSTTSMQFLRNGSLAAGTKDGSLYLIEETAARIGENEGSITTVKTGDDVIVAATSSRIYLYDSYGTEITRFTVESLVDCDVSQNGFIVAAGTQRLYMFNENGEILWQKDVGDIKSVEISSDGKRMAVTTDNGIFFCNWTDTFYGTYLFPYPSREQYSFEDFKRVWTYSVPHVVTPYIKQRNMRVAVGDVTGDGVHEIIVSDEMNVVILDSEGNVVSEKDVEEEALHIALLDADRDTVPEIFCTVNDGRFNIFVLDFLDGKFEKVEEFDFTSYFDVSPGEAREKAIIPVVLYNIDEDENPEIIAVVNSGYTLKPRGVLAFEYPSGDVEWFYRSAAGVSIDAFCDIDEDGRPEIIVSSHSCCNGCVEGNRDDCHAYLIVLSLNGEEVWSKEIASELKVIRAGVEDIDKDGKIEIVGTVLDAHNVYGRIFVMDRNGEILYDKDVDYSLSLGGIVDFDRNGLKEIVVTDSNGNVSFYNHELELLKTGSIATFQLTGVEGINDIDGDGDLEIVVRVWDRSVKILNSDLTEEWSKTFEISPIPEGWVANVSGCGNDLLILIENALEMYSFEGEGEYSSPPVTTTPPPITAPPTIDPGNYRWSLAILAVILAAFSLIILRRIIKKRKIRKEPQNLMILSLEKRTETKYQVSLESLRGTIFPVRAARTIDISSDMRSEVIARIDYTSKVITNYLDPERESPLKKPTEELKKMGTVIYKNFVPRDFAQKLVLQYMVLEAEDVQIPWELMYSDQFFALKYAISRRVKSEKAPEIHKEKKREKKALIIADPTRKMPEAVTECDYLRKTLQDHFAVTYLKPEKAKKVDVMYHLSQGYDIIHYAGELRKEPCLPVYKDVLTCEEIERNLEGSPVVFLNGCGSAKTFSYDIEGLAEVFLQRGALSYIGSLWSIHDKKAAEIAAEFYRNCLQYPVGEALRLSREKYYSSEDITWAAFVMYGDPTLHLFR